MGVALALTVIRIGLGGGRAVEPRRDIDDFAPARQQPDPVAGTPDRNADPGQSLYDLVVRELAGNDYDLDLWSRVFAEMDGHRANTRAEYIKIRIEQLSHG